MTYATEVPHSPLHEKLGIKIIQASSHEVIGTMPVPGNTQPAGVLHGGRPPLWWRDWPQLPPRCTRSRNASRWEST